VSGNCNFVSCPRFCSRLHLYCRSVPEIDRSTDRSKNLSRLSAWTRSLFERSTFIQLYYKFPTLYESTKFITVLTTAAPIQIRSKFQYSDMSRRVVWKLVTDILHFVGRASSYKFLLISNLTHCVHVFTYFNSLHVSSITVLIIRRSNCINTSSGMISLCKRYAGQEGTAVPS
jgi:hypothetical protein